MGSLAGGLAPYPSPRGECGRRTPAGAGGRVKLRSVRPNPTRRANARRPPGRAAQKRSPGMTGASHSQLRGPAPSIGERRGDRSSAETTLAAATGSLLPPLPIGERAGVRGEPTSQPIDSQTPSPDRKAVVLSPRGEGENAAGASADVSLSPRGRGLGRGGTRREMINSKREKPRTGGRGFWFLDRNR